MTVSSLKELKKLLSLCRQQGVEIIKVDGIELVLRPEAPIKAKALKATSMPIIAPGGITEDTKIQTPDSLTNEQLMMWSVGGQ